MYHLVFSAKYRRVVFDAHVDDVLKEGSTHGLRIADCGFRCAKRGLRRGQLGEIRHTRPIRARQAADIQLNSSDIAALCGWQRHSRWKTARCVVSEVLGSRIQIQTHEPPGADPHAGWCGRGAANRLPPSAVLHAIRRLKPRLCARGVVANPRDTSVSLRFSPNHTPKRIGFKGAVKHATLH